MRDTHLDLRSHFMTHRRYIFSDPAFWLIGYIMIYHKITGSKFLYVPIKLHHLSPFGWTHPVATPLRSAPIRAPHGALALAAEVVDGILGPAGTKCRFFLFFFFSGDEKKPPEKCHVDVAFKNVSAHFSDPQVIHGILSCYRTRKNSEDCMSLGRKKIAAHIQMVHC